MLTRLLCIALLILTSAPAASLAQTLPTPTHTDTVIIDYQGQRIPITLNVTQQHWTSLSYAWAWYEIGRGPGMIVVGPQVVVMINIAPPIVFANVSLQAPPGLQFYGFFRTRSWPQPGPFRAFVSVTAQIPNGAPLVYFLSFGS